MHTKTTAHATNAFDIFSTHFTQKNAQIHLQMHIKTALNIAKKKHSMHNLILYKIICTKK